METVKDWQLPGVSGEGGMNRWSTDFYGTYVKGLHSFVILQWWIHVITFFQVLSMCSPKRDPNVNSEL